MHQNDFLILPHKKISLVGSSYLCPVCGASRSGRTIYSFGSFKVVKCASCSTIHLAPLPSQEGIYQLYNTNYFADKRQAHGYLSYRDEERLIKKTYRQRLSKLKKLYNNSRQFSRIHEIGCALGYGMEVAHELFDSEFSGSDISREALHECRKRGFSVYQSDLAGHCDIADSGSIDLVIAFDLIEHLCDIAAFDRWLARNTAPGAVFLLTTPDLDSLWNKILGKRSPTFKIPQHVVYFTTSTLCRALKSFELACAWPDFQYVSWGRLMERLRHGLGMTHQPVPHGQGLSVLVPNGMKLYAFKKRPQV
ncbi:MAG: class I SAM-dependent methyltransferase [Thermodesulfobacteriota bacterium]